MNGCAVFGLPIFCARTGNVFRRLFRCQKRVGAGRTIMPVSVICIMIFERVFNAVRMKRLTFLPVSATDTVEMENDKLRKTERQEASGVMLQFGLTVLLVLDGNPVDFVELVRIVLQYSQRSKLAESKSKVIFSEKIQTSYWRSLFFSKLGQVEDEYALLPEDFPPNAIAYTQYLIRKVHKLGRFLVMKKFNEHVAETFRTLPSEKYTINRQRS